MTRGMIVAILYRMAGSPAVTGGSVFDDVAADRYYTSAVTWASANGLANGYGNGNFGPDDVIARKQLAAFLYRYAKLKGDAVDSKDGLSHYQDAAQVSTYARDAMAWANAKGLITGTQNGTLLPGESATRAQTAVILMRFCEGAGT